MMGYHGWGEKNSLGLNPRNPLKDDHYFLIAKVQSGQVLLEGLGGCGFVIKPWGARFALWYLHQKGAIQGKGQGMPKSQTEGAYGCGGCRTRQNPTEIPLYSRKQELMSPECSVLHYHRHQQKLGLEMLISQGEIISHSQPGVQFKMINA